jgi:hypothetical protein
MIVHCTINLRQFVQIMEATKRGLPAIFEMGIIQIWGRKDSKCKNEGAMDNA